MPACVQCGRANPEGAKFCSACGARISSDAPIPAAARKVVTVVFADLTGFTALAERLDAESLQQVVGRWFAEAERVVARHGGAIEKFIGDAVMAVFGVPVVHEDDALRAARAALEMRDTLVDLNEELGRRWGERLEVRIGVNTGEVVIGRAPGGQMSTLGDAVNVAQRLEASAPPGEVLIGAETARLLGAAAELDPVKPLALKGKATPVTASRLLSVASEFAAPPARAEAQFVDREGELQRLVRTFETVVAEGTPRMVTVLGPPGIGKSSLVRAFLAGARKEATAVAGRCLPYGDGITYWPVTEIVRGLAGSGTETAIAAVAGGGAAEGEADPIATRLARVAGFATGTVAVEEAQWAVRKLLEGLARSQPLVVVVEDIHWAEPTFLDLLEYLATLMAEVPVMLICLARPELFDERPAWATVGGRRATMVPLEPLPPREAGKLLDQLAGGAEMKSTEGAQLLDAAEGNPFFLQQMVAVRAEAGEDVTVLPPTIQAVLTARIDRLPPGERAVIERGSIEGRTFHRGSLAELLPGGVQEDLDVNLAELVRRGLICPSRPDFEGEEAFGFDHILIRDATYGLMPKHLRADLHERHAGWLEGRAGRDSREHAELVGYHLEQAFRCHVDVEPAARESQRSLAARGARRLGDAGRGALARDDVPAAINLLERATALLPQDDAALRELWPELGMALRDAGRLSDAERVLDLAVMQAAARDDDGAQAHAEVARLSVRLQVDTEAGAREVRERFDPLRATFERGGDDLGLGRLWRLRALVYWIQARSAHADAAWERGAEHARQAGDERGWSEALLWLASSAHIGPTPVEDAIARCETIRAQLRGHRRRQALVVHPLAGLRAMRGEFDAARRLLAESNAVLTELGVTMDTAVSHHEAEVALLSDDAAGAEAVLRRGYERLAEMGEKALLATTAAMLAQAIYEQGRFNDAWAFTEAAEDAAAADDLSVQITWRAVRARLLARGGETAEAKRISAEAVALAERTDWLTDHADALLSQAQVLKKAGDPKAAAEALRSAIELYTRKGNTIGAKRAGASLDIEVPV